jgi:hypothetical protein
MTVEISTHGMCVRTKLELLPGDSVGVITEGHYPSAIPALVVWIRKEESSARTFAGLEFSNAHAG